MSIQILILKDFFPSGALYSASYKILPSLDVLRLLSSLFGELIAKMIKRHQTYFLLRKCDYTPSLFQTSLFLGCLWKSGAQVKPGVDMRGRTHRQSDVRSNLRVREEVSWSQKYGRIWLLPGLSVLSCFWIYVVPLISYRHLQNFLCRVASWRIYSKILYLRIELQQPQKQTSCCSWSQGKIHILWCHLWDSLSCSSLWPLYFLPPPSDWTLSPTYFFLLNHITIGFLSLVRTSFVTGSHVVRTILNPYNLSFSFHTQSTHRYQTLFPTQIPFIFGYHHLTCPHLILSFHFQDLNHSPNLTHFKYPVVQFTVLHLSWFQVRAPKMFQLCETLDNSLWHDFRNTARDPSGCSSPCPLSVSGTMFLSGQPECPPAFPTACKIYLKEMFPLNQRKLISFHLPHPPK